MIPQKTMEVSTVESNISGESIQMTIDESSLQHIMSVLTDLYSDTRLATIRELSTNARDAQIDAGRGHLPIEVSTPNGLSPSFKVRDSGVGLSLDDIRNVFSKYGASTKRGSNDVNGMLGLGAKAPLTYTSSFTVTSTKDGETNVVSVGRNEDGGGYMEIVATFPNVAGSGTEIQVPVPQHESAIFRDKIERFFKYWEAGTVKIDGVLNEGWNWSGYIKIDDRTYVSEGFGSGGTIVMGGVAYPAPFDSELQVPFVHFADIGAVVFSPSRESLLTNRQNREYFDAIVKKIKAGIVEALIKRISGAETEYAAVKAYESIKSSPLSNGLTSQNHASLTYNGKKAIDIRDKMYQIANSTDNLCVAHIPDEGARFRGCITASVYYKDSLFVNMSRATVIISGVGYDVIDHSGRRASIMRGLRHFNHVNTYAIFCDDHTEISKMFDNKFTVVTAEEVRQASREALKERKGTGVSRPKSKPDENKIEVISSVRDGVANTNFVTDTSNGKDMVYISRKGLREGGTVQGSNVYERSNSFNGIINTFTDKTFVVVADNDRDNFLKVYPKSESFKEFSDTISTSGFEAKVMAHGAGKFTKDDLLAWGRTSATHSAYYMGNERNLSSPEIYELAGNTPDSETLTKYRKQVDATARVNTSVNEVAKQIGNALSNFALLSYLSENAERADVASNQMLLSDVIKAYPLLNLLNDTYLRTDPHGVRSECVKYVKGVDSGLLN